nr:unnamed protein product [Digitaria exilis]
MRRRCGWLSSLCRPRRGGRALPQPDQTRPDSEPEVTPIVMMLDTLKFCFMYNVEQVADKRGASDEVVMQNILSNSDFSEGLHLWQPNSCHAFVAVEGSGYHYGVRPHSGSSYAVLTHRTQSWQGLEQDITEKVTSGTEYFIAAYVRIYGDVHEPIGVQATLKFEDEGSSTNYLSIARTLASQERWEKMEGSFNLTTLPRRLVFYLEGPPSSVDLLIDSVTISYKKAERSVSSLTGGTENIISNYDFSKGLHPWSPICCHAYVASQWSGFIDGIRGSSGENYAVVSKRTEHWQGLEQDITNGVSTGTAYVVSAFVRVDGNVQGQVEVKGTLRLQNTDGSIHYNPVGSGFASATGRVHNWNGIQQEITGRVQRKVLYEISSAVRIFGSANDTEVRVTLWVQEYGRERYVGLAKNMASDKQWTHLKGRFLLHAPFTKAVIFIEGPPAGIDILVDGLVLSPARKLQAAPCPKIENVRYGANLLDNSAFTRGLAGWSPMGSLEADGDQWYEIKGAFKLEKQPSKVTAYVQGPPPGVDLRVMDLQIYPVDRKARFEYLKEKTDKVRKRDIVLKFQGSNAINLLGSSVRIQQTENSFPIGSCISRHNIENEDFSEFFAKNFNWAVFENELKWFVVTAYSGKWKTRSNLGLGRDIRAYMFREAHKLDPSAVLFVNDYNVEDGCDSKSTPEKFVEQVVDLQERGAPVGGIGMQGHITHPVGEIICDSLDKLAILGLPIWITELDVTAENEHIRADDLEVFLREAFAHPAVGGIILWGFWEMFMFREHAHLVEADGTINEAGRRYLALKQEWLTRVNGNVSNQGEFMFRGYHGSYTVEVDTPSGKVARSFVVEQDSPVQVISLNI